MYAQLAVNAGAIKPQQVILIRNVRGHSRKASKNVDDDRSAAGIATRTSTKKRENVKLDKKHRRALKEQPDTPQGRRDAVIMALLLDHGLRVGELALLEVTAFDLKADTFTFYRPKVDKKQTHKLEKDSRKAIDRWFATDAPAMGPLLRSSRKGGKQKAADGRRVFGNGILGDAGMSERAITERVRELGEAIGIEGLSAHDCRHSWATQIARRMRKEKRVDPFALQGAGGWNSLAMPRRYIDEAAIANEGIEVDDSE
jgi:integrase